MKTTAALIGLLVVILLAPLSENAAGGGLMLVNGVGVPGELEIGDKSPKSGSSKEEKLKSWGLDWEINRDTNSVVSIRCYSHLCYTDNNIAVREKVETILRRQGPPIRKIPDKQTKGELFLYKGVAFLVVNNSVEVIYILPRLKKGRL